MADVLILPPQTPVDSESYPSGRAVAHRRRPPYVPPERPAELTEQPVPWPGNVVDFDRAAVEAPQLPDEIQVGAVLDPRLRVIRPWLVRFSAEDSGVAAEAPAFNEFGFGDDRSEALRDLQRAIGQLWFSLHELGDQLGPDLVAVRAELTKHFQLR